MFCDQISQSLFLHIFQGFGTGSEMPDLCTGKSPLVPGKTLEKNVIRGC